MAIHNEDLKRLQAMTMIHLKVNGHGNREIADKMNISVDTVERRLTWAERAGMFVKFEQQIIDELVPKSIEAIKTALEDGDAETALEVLKSVGVLKDPKAPKTQVEQQESDDLAKAISEARIEQKKLEGTVDGQIINDRGSLAGLLTSGDQSEVVEQQPSAETSVAEANI